MRFEAILYDLDGTLLDTLEDIANAANAVLRRHGFPEHTLDAYRYFVGDGVPALIWRILPEQERHAEAHASCVAALREEYLRHLNVKTRPYPGIREAVVELKSRGFKQGVLSNKPHELTCRCVDQFFPGLFDTVRGHSDSFPAKPDPSAALDIASGWGLAPGSVLYLGDTDTDMKTAMAAGMYPLGALWGFRTSEELKANGAKALAGEPADIPRFLEEIGPSARRNEAEGFL